MKNLRELSIIINEENLRATKAKMSFFDGDNLLAKLYQGIANDSFITDKEAQNELYPDQDSYGSYRKTKSTLKKVLKDAILVSDFNKLTSNSYQKAYYSCHKECAVVKILLGQNARHSAIDIASSLLIRAKKYEFTEIVLDMASILRLHYGARIGNLEKFNYYNHLYRSYGKIHFLEQKAEDAYLDLVINYVNSRSPKSEQHLYAKDAIAELENLVGNNWSYKFLLYYFLIKLMERTTVYDYQATLEICEDAISIFEKKPYPTNLPLQILFYQQLVCHIQLKQFEQGQKAAAKCSGLITEGSFNWFKFQELLFFLFMHTGQYEKAAKIFKNTTNHKRFQFLAENLKEVWKIFEAYLYFLKSVGELGIYSEAKVGNKEFRLNRFLNEVIISSKDKSGLNSTVIIAQILIYIAEKRYDNAIDRLEATLQYCYRYLNGKHTKRTFIFLKLLLKFPQLDFDKSLIIKKSRSLLKELNEIPIETANQAIEMEIIPYGKLWRLIVNILD